jgi:hypothetical protein
VRRYALVGWPWQRISSTGGWAEQARSTTEGSIPLWHGILNVVLWYGGALLFFVLLILSWRANERERTPELAAVRGHSGTLADTGFLSPEGDGRARGLRNSSFGLEPLSDCCVASEDRRTSGI